MSVDFLSNKDTETHRVCGSCNELKLNADFYRDGKDNHGKTRYRRDCKDCYKRTRIFEERERERK